MEPGPSALGAQSLSQWTTRGVQPTYSDGGKSASEVVDTGHICEKEFFLSFSTGIYYMLIFLHKDE